jgi:ABC-type nickel/cobalt efflux system permease component RcnA
MTISLIAAAGIGLLLGFRHAFEPDHLAAVSTLATRNPRLAAALKLGAAWGIGHTVSIGAAALAVMIFGLRLPAGLQPAAELLVAALLILLGLPVVLRYAGGRWHMHLHEHDGAPHIHLHSHAEQEAHAHGHVTGDARRSLGLGLAHGLAGSAGVLLLIVAAAPTAGAQLAYLVAFGAGTIAGMLSVSAGLALVVRLVAQRRGTRWATVLHVASAAVSVCVGLFWAGKVLQTL